VSVSAIVIRIIGYKYEVLKPDLIQAEESCIETKNPLPAAGRGFFVVKKFYLINVLQQIHNLQREASDTYKNTNRHMLC
jgi:hypothetical protein